MKLAFAHAIAVAGSLALAMADQVAPSPAAHTTNIASHNASAPEGITVNRVCENTPPFGGIYNWYYNSKAEGPYGCTNNHDTKSWAMMNAYRSGGTQGVHYKYTDDPNDPECLTYWTYYTSDGNSAIEKQIPRTTFNGDTRRWCGLPVYRSGGVQGKQWDYCMLFCH